MRRSAAYAALLACGVLVSTANTQGEGLFPTQTFKSQRQFLDSNFASDNQQTSGKYSSSAFGPEIADVVVNYIQIDMKFNSKIYTSVCGDGEQFVCDPKTKSCGCYECPPSCCFQTEWDRGVSTFVPDRKCRCSDGSLKAPVPSASFSVDVDKTSATISRQLYEGEGRLMEKVIRPAVVCPGLEGFEVPMQIATAPAKKDAGALFFLLRANKDLAQSSRGGYYGGYSYSPFSDEYCSDTDSTRAPVLFIVSEVVENGVKRKSGPTMDEFNQYCTVLPNVFTLTDGNTAVQPLVSALPGANIGAYDTRLSCDYEDFRGLYAEYREALAELQSAGAFNCSNTSDSGTEFIAKSMLHNGRDAGQPSAGGVEERRRLQYGTASMSGMSSGYYGSMSAEDKCANAKNERDFKVNKAFRKIFALTGRDAWQGCVTLTRSLKTVEQQDIDTVSDECDKDPSKDKEAFYQDPCCNKQLEQTMCCAPRAAKLTVETVTGDEAATLASYCLADVDPVTGQSTGFFIREASSYADTFFNDLRLGQACGADLQSFEKLVKNADPWQLLSDCQTAVLGEYDYQSQQMKGAKCNSDADCPYSKECIVSASAGTNGLGITPQSNAKGTCKLVPGSEAKNLVLCVMDKLNDPKLQALFEAKANVQCTNPASTPEEKQARREEVAAALAADMTVTECRGPDVYQLFGNERGKVPWGQMPTEEQCLSVKSCNMDPNAKTEEACLNPTDGSSAEPQCTMADMMYSSMTLTVKSACLIKDFQQQMHSCYKQQQEYTQSFMNKGDWSGYTDPIPACAKALCESLGGSYQKGQYSQPECVDTSKTTKEECEAECTEGPNPVPQVVCYKQRTKDFPCYVYDHSCSVNAQWGYLTSDWAYPQHQMNYMMGGPANDYCQLYQNGYGQEYCIASEYNSDVGSWQDYLNLIRAQQQTGKCALNRWSPVCSLDCNTNFESCLATSDVKTCVDSFLNGEMDKCGDGTCQVLHGCPVNSKGDCCTWDKPCSCPLDCAGLEHKCNSAAWNDHYDPVTGAYDNDAANKAYQECQAKKEGEWVESGVCKSGCFSNFGVLPDECTTKPAGWENIDCSCGTDSNFCQCSDTCIEKFNACTASSNYNDCNFKLKYEWSKTGECAWNCVPWTVYKPPVIDDNTGGNTYPTQSPGGDTYTTEAYGGETAYTTYSETDNAYTTDASGSNTYTNAASTGSATTEGSGSSTTAASGSNTYTNAASTTEGSGSSTTAASGNSERRRMANELKGMSIAEAMARKEALRKSMQGMQRAEFEAKKTHALELIESAAANRQSAKGRRLQATGAKTQVTDQASCEAALGAGAVFGVPPWKQDQGCQRYENQCVNPLPNWAEYQYDWDRNNACSNQTANMYGQFSRDLFGGTGGCILWPGSDYIDGHYVNKPCPEGWTVYKKTREWRAAQYDTKESCEVGYCAMNSKINDETECAQEEGCSTGCNVCTNDPQFYCNRANGGKYDPDQEKGACLVPGAASKADCDALGAKLQADGNVARYIRDFANDGRLKWNEQDKKCYMRNGSNRKSCESEGTDAKTPVKFVTCGDFSETACYDNPFRSELMCWLLPTKCRNQAECASRGKCTDQQVIWQLNDKQSYPDGVCVVPMKKTASTANPEAFGNCYFEVSDIALGEELKAAGFDPADFKLESSYGVSGCVLRYKKDYEKQTAKMNQMSPNMNSATAGGMPMYTDPSTGQAKCYNNYDYMSYMFNGPNQYDMCADNSNNYHGGGGGGSYPGPVNPPSAEEVASNCGMMVACGVQTFEDMMRSSWNTTNHADGTESIQFDTCYSCVTYATKGCSQFGAEGAGPSAEEISCVSGKVAALCTEACPATCSKVISCFDASGKLTSECVTDFQCPAELEGFFNGTSSNNGGGSNYYPSDKPYYPGPDYGNGSYPYDPYGNNTYPTGRPYYPTNTPSMNMDPTTCGLMVACGVSSAKDAMMASMGDDSCFACVSKLMKVCDPSDNDGEPSGEVIKCVAEKTATECVQCESTTCSDVLTCFGKFGKLAPDCVADYACPADMSGSSSGGSSDPYYPGYNGTDEYGDYNGTDNIPPYNSDPYSNPEFAFTCKTAASCGVDMFATSQDASTFDDNCMGCFNNLMSSCGFSDGMDASRPTECAKQPGCHIGVSTYGPGQALCDDSCSKAVYQCLADKAAADDTCSKCAAKDSCTNTFSCLAKSGSDNICVDTATCNVPSSNSGSPPTRSPPTRRMSFADMPAFSWAKRTLQRVATDPVNVPATDMPSEFTTEYPTKDPNGNTFPGGTGTGPTGAGANSGGQNVVNEAICAQAGGQMFRAALSKEQCTASSVCCKHKLPDGSCRYNWDIVSGTDAENCDSCGAFAGATQLFQWIDLGKWGPGTFYRPYKFVERKWETRNSWVQTVDQNKLRRLLEDVLGDLASERRVTYTQCKLSPLLESLKVVVCDCGFNNANCVTDNVAPITPSLGTSTIVPCTTDTVSSSKGAVAVSPESLVTDGDAATTSLELKGDGASTFVGSEASLSGSRRVRRSRRLAEATGGLSVQEADTTCWVVVQNNNKKLVGQLLGDCLEVAVNGGSVTNSGVQVCLNVAKMAQDSQTFPAVDFALVADGKLVPAGLTTATLSADGRSVCATVTTAGKYCPIRRYTVWDSASVASADGSCGAVNDVLQAAFTVQKSAGKLPESASFVQLSEQTPEMRVSNRAAVVNLERESAAKENLKAEIVKANTAAATAAATAAGVEVPPEITDKGGNTGTGGTGGNSNQGGAEEEQESGKSSKANGLTAVYTLFAAFMCWVLFGM